MSEESDQLGNLSDGRRARPVLPAPGRAMPRGPPPFGLAGQGFLFLGGSYWRAAPGIRRLLEFQADKGRVTRMASGGVYEIHWSSLFDKLEMRGVLLVDKLQA